jgi:hypothetical protein
MTGGGQTRFEDRLLAELLPLVGVVQPAGGPLSGQLRPPGPRRGRRPPTRVAALLGLLVLVLAAAGLGVAAWPQRLATPAYAVQEQPDGTLLVTVNDLGDPRGLQALLGAHGVPAAVLVVDPAAACTTPLETVPAPGAIRGMPDHPNALAIRPDLLPPGTLAVLALSGGGGDRGGDGGGGGAPGGAAGPQGGLPSVLFAVVRGPAPRCFPGAVPVPVPAPTAS